MKMIVCHCNHDYPSDWYWRSVITYTY